MAKKIFIRHGSYRQSTPFFQKWHESKIPIDEIEKKLGPYAFKNFCDGFIERKYYDETNIEFTKYRQIDTLINISFFSYITQWFSKSLFVPFLLPFIAYSVYSIFYEGLQPDFKYAFFLFYEKGVFGLFAFYIFYCTYMDLKTEMCKFYNFIILGFVIFGLPSCFVFMNSLSLSEVDSIQKNDQISYIFLSFFICLLSKVYSFWLHEKHLLDKE